MNEWENLFNTTIFSKSNFKIIIYVFNRHLISFYEYLSLKATTKSTY